MSRKLNNFRKQIDSIDEQMLILLGKRMSIVRRIGKFKKKEGLSALDRERWDEIIESSMKKGKELGLSQVFIKKLLKLVHNYSLEIQKD